MSYEIRAMSMGEVLDTGFRLVRAHFVPLVGIALTVSLPVQVLVQLVTGFETAPGAMTIASAVGLLLFIVVVSPVVGAAITYAVSEFYQGREATIKSSLGVGLRLLLPLMGTAILMTLLTAVGMVLLIIPGIYLAIAWMLTYQVMVIEKRAGWNALKRTRELSGGHLLRILGVALVAAILMTVVSVALDLATMSIPLLSTVVSSIVQAVYTAYLSAAFVVLYFDIRCRKEAFDLEHLAGLVEAENPLGRSAGATP